MNRQMFFPSTSKFPRLALGLVLGLTTSLAAQPAPAAAENPSIEPSNGTYLYGESAASDQIGQGYVVFNHKNGRVVGALYYPASEFSCFSGAIADRQLDIVSLETVESPKMVLQMPLSKMYPIQSLTEMSKNALSVCEQEVAAQDNGHRHAEKP
jgi:hypothetical protein